MKIDKKKIKRIAMEGEMRLRNIMLGGEDIHQVREFKYLASIISENLQLRSKTKTKIAVGKETLSRKRKLMCGLLDKQLRK